MTQTVKNLPAMQETQVQSLNWEDLLRRAWLPTPVFLPGEFHEQRSLMGYSPWGRKESDMTAQLTLRASSAAQLTHFPAQGHRAGSPAPGNRQHYPPTPAPTHILCTADPLPAPRRIKGLVCRRLDIRCWASVGRASSPSGHRMSSTEQGVGWGLLLGP